MKKTTRRSPPGITYRMAPKRLVDQHVLPAGSVLIDQLHDRSLGRFLDPEPEPEIEGNFYLDEEEDAASRPEGTRQDAMKAVVGAAFEAATSPDQRRRLRHGQAMCAIIQVPTPAWVGPVSAYFRCVFGERWVQQTHDGSDLRGHGHSNGSSGVSSALSAGQSVVGISADVSLLPRTLVGAADLAIRLTHPDGSVVKTAITRFAKRAPAEVEDFIAGELDLDDILAAFRPGSGPQRIAQRLAAAAAALRAHRNLEKETQSCSS
jgi:hypothetical protein